MVVPWGIFNIKDISVQVQFPPYHYNLSAHQIGVLDVHDGNLVDAKKSMQKVHF